LYLGGPLGAAALVAGWPVAIMETPHRPRIAAPASAKMFQFARIHLSRRDFSPRSDRPPQYFAPR
jgi:hypothetical protein